MNEPTAVGLVPLDPWDELFHSISSQYGGTGSGAAVVHVRGTIEPQRLRDALECLQQRHPKLRSRLVTTAGGRHAFDVRPNPPPIPCEVKDVDTADLPWKDEGSRLLAATLDPGVDPLARLVVLRAPGRQRCVLILMTHHALGDGRSLVRLVHDLFEYYGEIEQRGAPALNSLPVAAARRARPSGSAWKRLVQALRLIRNRRDNRKADWTWLPHAEGIPPGRLWDHVVFTERDTLALSQRCRREKTTLYGVLYAAAARSLLATLAQPTARFKCRFPIDVRQQLTGASGPVTGEDLGNFVGGFEAIYHVDRRSDLWALARRARVDMDHFTAGGGPALVYNAIRFLKLPYVPPTPRRGTILVNSYGVLDLRDRYGSLGVEELSVVFNNVAAGPSLLIQGFVIQRRLNLSLSMVDVPERFWERVRDTIKDEFQEAIHGEPHDQRAIPA